MYKQRVNTFCVKAFAINIILKILESVKGNMKILMNDLSSDQSLSNHNVVDIQ